MYESIDEDGHVHKHESSSSCTKYEGSSILPYYSSRDISGLFYLNCDNKAKTIRLEITSEINFADAISYHDYLEEKKFVEKKYKNNYCDYFETLNNRYFQGQKQYYLIPLNHDSSNWFLNFCFYIFITLIGFAEIYKIYFRCCCSYNHFIIRKLFSIRYVLVKIIIFKD